MLNRYRKAIAAFILPFLGLPIFDWISGNSPFDWTLVQGAVGAAVTALVVYFVPNAQLPTDLLKSNGAPTDGWGDTPPPVAG